MGANGTDLLLSPAARRVFPFSAECGNQESINIWKKIAQAHAGAHPETTPIVVFRKNHTPPFVALPWEIFLDLVEYRARVHASA
jgi:hypothetical protein